MKLLGRNRLLPLFGLDEPTDVWLRGWVAEVSNATWKRERDVLRQFPRTRTAEANVFLFPVKNLQQQIEVAIVFPQAVALVVDLKRMN
jgi:mRNA-degrading endonuclease HigB of HigAB toxin-antitoxin module